MMKPIEFTLTQQIGQSAPTICDNIADMSRWPEFTGYGILPGIQSAEYENRTSNMVGSRIKVINTDGSSHIEEILAWHPGQSVVMKLHNFSPPLSHLADHFLEEWRFVEHSGQTLATRSFKLYPKNILTRPLIWLISIPFKQAIAAHLALMAKQADGSTN